MTRPVPKSIDDGGLPLSGVDLLSESQSIYIHATMTPHLSHHKYCENITGYDLRIKGAFPLDTLSGDKITFFGVHNHLFMTVRKPERVTDLIGVSKDLPQVSPYTNTVWIGQGKVKYTKSGMIMVTVPSTVLDLAGSELSGDIELEGFIRRMTGVMGAFIYYILELPAITREYILGE